MNGERPALPVDATSSGLSDALWEVLKECWNQDRDQRPRIAAVHTVLLQAAPSWIPPPLSEAGFGSNFNTLRSSTKSWYGLAQAFERESLKGDQGSKVAPHIAIGDGVDSPEEGIVSRFH
jgi:hypothetical protein